MDQKQGLDEAHPSVSRNIFGKIVLAIRLLKTLIFDPLKRLCRSDILILNHERKILRGNTYICKYTDVISKAYPQAIILEKPYQEGHLRPTDRHNLFFTDSISIKGRLYSIHAMKFRKKYVGKLKAEIFEELNDALSEMQKTYDIKLDIDKLLAEITRRFIICKKKKMLWKQVIEKIQPKAIIETVHYSMDNMLINEIAANMGIPTIELQHGTIHNEHIAYQYAQVQRPIPQLPKYILTFSEYWNDIVNMPGQCVKLISVGFPYFEEKVVEGFGNHEANSNKKIIFLSQGTIGTKLSRLASDLAGILSGEYQIIYKLHPSEYHIWKDKCPWLNNGNVTVIDDNSIDLYGLFAISYAQVGVYSTAIYEGLGFRLRTFIYNIEMAATMGPLCDIGYATMFDSAPELKNLLDKDQKGIESVEILWMKNAKENMLQAIDEIVPFPILAPPRIT
jgi:hypothetical protein